MSLKCPPAPGPPLLPPPGKALPGGEVAGASPPHCGGRGAEEGGQGCHQPPARRDQGGGHPGAGLLHGGRSATQQCLIPDNTGIALQGQTTGKKRKGVPPAKNTY